MFFSVFSRLQELVAYLFPVVCCRESITEVVFEVMCLIDNRCAEIRLEYQMDITNVTEKSFTLKSKYRNRPSAMNGDVRGEVTFSIVFDENAQDWRIDKTEYTDSQG